MHGWRQGADRLRRDEGIEYELIIASKDNMCTRNAAHPERQCLWRHFKQSLNRFNSVATKCLPSYLGSRRWLERGEDIVAPQTALVAALG